MLVPILQMSKLRSREIKSLHYQEKGRMKLEHKVYLHSSLITVLLASLLV